MQFADGTRKVSHRMNYPCKTAY